MAAVDKLNITVNTSGPGSIPLLSKTTFNIVALTAANFTAQGAAAGTLQAAYVNLTDGVVRERAISVTTLGGTGYPSGVANRGQKWILSATNVVGAKYTYTIPAAPGLGELNSDNLTANLAGTYWAAFKTAFEAVCVDPFGGALTLNFAKLGGRRR